MTIVNWGIIGPGRIANTFCSDASLVANANVVAVASRNINNASAFAQQHGIDRFYEGYESIYTNSLVDAIYIATPHNFHFEQCLMALEAGKHVLCEKPFTVTPEECEILTQLAHQKGCFIMEAMWTHFLPAIRQALNWYKEGRIGELVHINADFGYPIEYEPNKREYSTNTAGGCIFEMGIYPISLVHLFTQHSPTFISTLIHRAPNGVEDDVKIQAKYGDTSASIGTSFRARLVNSAQIIGTDGYIVIPDFFRASECSLHVLDETIEQFEDKRQGQGFEFQIQACCNHILEGDIESSVVPLSSSLTWQHHIQSVLA